MTNLSDKYAQESMMDLYCENWIKKIIFFCVENGNWIEVYGRYF